MHHHPSFLFVAAAVLNIRVSQVPTVSLNRLGQLHHVRKRQHQSPIFYGCAPVSLDSLQLHYIALMPFYDSLMKEYKDLTNDEDPSFTAGPVREDDFFEWEALITGPEGTPFVSG
jgi:hypothetical protein